MIKKLICGLFGLFATKGLYFSIKTKLSISLISLISLTYTQEERRVSKVISKKISLKRFSKFIHNKATTIKRIMKYVIAKVEFELAIN